MVPCPEIMMTFGRILHRADFFQNFQAVNAGEPHIQENEIEAALTQQLQAVFALGLTLVL